MLKLTRFKNGMLLLAALLAVAFVFWQTGLLEKVFGLSAEEKQPPSKQTRTLKFFIFQNPVVLISPNSTTTQFDIFIGEQEPVIKSAYIEIHGVTKQSASQTITADINQADSFPTSRQESFTLDSSGKPNNFKILYNGSVTQNLTDYLAGIITSAGSYGFYFKLGVSGADVSLAQAQLIITYQFKPPTAGAYPATGELTSAVFDTATDGAAYNSVMWKGSFNGSTGKVRFQIATSDNPNGPWTYIGGSNCNSGDWYDPGNPETPAEITCAPSYHNNHRYFRYKVQICSASNCSDGGSATPQVTDVVVSWSP